MSGGDTSVLCEPRQSEAQETFTRGKTVLIQAKDDLKGEFVGSLFATEQGADQIQKDKGEESREW